MIAELGHDSISLRDSRYNQVVHMMSAARGAEKFYHLDNNPARSEGLDLAKKLDKAAAMVSVKTKQTLKCHALSPRLGWDTHTTMLWTTMYLTFRARSNELLSLSASA